MADDSHKASSAHDTVFKQLIRTFCFPTLQMVAPKMARAIDPASIHFLNVETFVDPVGGRRLMPDVLAKARLKRPAGGLPAGKEVCLVFHFEFQSKREPDFARRM